MPNLVAYIKAYKAGLGDAQYEQKKPGHVYNKMCRYDCKKQILIKSTM